MNDRPVIISPRQFAAPKIMQVKQGASILMIIDQMYVGVPEIYRDYNLIVELNGQIITRERWNIIPGVSDHILIYVSVHGGSDSNGGKNPLRTILTVVLAIVSIVVTIYAPYLAPASWGLVGANGVTGAGAVVGTLAGAAVGAAGSVMINALFPVTMGAGSLSQETGNFYGYSGTSNKYLPWGAVPVVLGTHKIFPPMGAKPYTEVSGNKEYLRMLFIWGEGPLKIENIKIGETLLTSFKDVEVETREGWPDDAAITLVPAQVHQDQIGIEIKKSGGRSVRAARPYVDELSVEVICPVGLCLYNDQGGRAGLTVRMKLEYREIGTEEWTELIAPVTNSFAGEYVMFAALVSDDTLYSIYITPVSNPHGAPTASYSYAEGEGEIAGAYRIATAIRTDGVFIVTKITPEGTTGFNPTGDANAVVISSGTITTMEPFTIVDNSINPVRRARKWAVDKTKAYEVGLSRETLDTDSTKIFWKTYWANLQSFVNDHPVKYPRPLAMTALRIRMSEQLQGMIDNLSGTVSTYCETWDGDEWSGSEVSNNPAALSRYVLKHPANVKARTNAQLNEDVYGAWYEFCETNGYAFNQIRDGRTGIWDVLQTLATAGRGAPTLIDGKWGSIWDDNESAPVIQHITPRNSWGFQAEKILYRPPHGFRVAFKNELNDYADDEIIVYDDGYNAGNATIFESLELPGITYPDLVWKFTRYQMAQARLRPEIFSVQMDFEHLVCRRGSKVLVSHDVPRWGGYTGRVKSLITAADTAAGTVALEDLVLDMDDGEAFADLTAAVFLPFVAYHGKLTITDSAGKKIVGYISTVEDSPATGATITSTPGGATRNWAVAEEGFNYADEAGYEYLVDYTDIDDNGRIFGLVIDEKITMEVDKSYACRFRRASESDESIVLSITTQAGEHNTLMLAYSGGLSPSACPVAGDLAMFGEASTETAVCLVRSIERADELSARVTFVDLAPAIYQADAGVIPPYDSQITNIVPFEKLRPAPPVIIRVDSGTVALEVFSGVIRSRIVVHIASPGGYVPIEKFRFRFRQTDSESWDVLEIPSDATAVYYREVTDGQSYIIQAQSVSSKGVYSEWTDERTETVIGQEEAPSDVTGFRCNILGSDAYLSWDANPVTDVDLSHYRIRFTPDKVAPTWNSSIDLVEKVGKPSTSVTVPAMVGTYLIKAVDYNGNESENAAVYITTIAGLAGVNFVVDLSLPPWDGTEDGLVYDEGLDALILEVSDDEMLEEGYFEADEIVDLGEIYTCRLSAQITITASDLYEDLYDYPDLYALANLYGLADGATDAKIEISTTNDDPESDPTWSDWKPLIVGDYAARAFKFRIYGRGTLPSITPVISSVTITVDMEDRIVAFEETVTVDGIRVAFDPAFYVTPKIGLAVLDGQEGDYYEITNKDETGFDIEFFNNSISVERNISGIAKAYGAKEE